MSSLGKPYLFSQVPYRNLGTIKLRYFKDGLFIKGISTRVRARNGVGETQGIVLEPVLTNSTTITTLSSRR